MLLNLTYVPTPWRLEGKALGFALTSDLVASAGDCANEFIMFNTSNSTVPSVFFTPHRRSACVLSVSEAFTSDTLTPVSSLIRMVEGQPRSRYPGFWEMLSRESPRAPVPSPGASSPATRWTYHHVTLGTKADAAQSPSCTTSLSSPLKSPPLYPAGLPLWSQRFVAAFGQ